ncbi:thiol-disulfide oxidoreductase DCC family protein [Algivirga pacifica]|uniref:Thiol-disulfide oxidoreductase DCC family protein n=1 Tax=Algivirga pacifica TaxID=1162670 RepID=A0ABP9DDZ1_9BACT
MTTKVILFDGVCNLCNGTVNFIIDRDPKGKFQFASLQSEEGEKVLQQNGIAEVSLDSVVLLKNGQLYKKSTAALHIARELKGAWPLFYGFIIVPRFIRDGVYNWIAKNRYKWFGKSDACRIPTPELKERFL